MPVSNVVFRKVIRFLSVDHFPGPQVISLLHYNIPFFSILCFNHYIQINDSRDLKLRSRMLLDISKRRKSQSRVLSRWVLFDMCGSQVS